MVKTRDDFYEQLCSQFPNIDPDDIKMCMSIGDLELARYASHGNVMLSKDPNIVIQDMPSKVEMSNTSIFIRYKKAIFNKLKYMLAYLAIDQGDAVYVNVDDTDYLAIMAGFNSTIPFLRGYHSPILAELSKSDWDYTLKLNIKTEAKYPMFSLYDVDITDHIVIEAPKEKPISHFFNTKQKYRKLYDKTQKRIQ